MYENYEMSDSWPFQNPIHLPWCRQVSVGLPIGHAVILLGGYACYIADMRPGEIRLRACHIVVSSG